MHEVPGAYFSDFSVSDDDDDVGVQREDVIDLSDSSSENDMEGVVHYELPTSPPQPRLPPLEEAQASPPEIIDLTNESSQESIGQPPDTDMRSIASDVITEDSASEDHIVADDSEGSSTTPKSTKEDTSSELHKEFAGLLAELDSIPPDFHTDSRRTRLTELFEKIHSHHADLHTKSQRLLNLVSSQARFDVADSAAPSLKPERKENPASNRNKNTDNRRPATRSSSSIARLRHRVPAFKLKRKPKEVRDAVGCIYVYAHTPDRTSSDQLRRALGISSRSRTAVQRSTLHNRPLDSAQTFRHLSTQSNTIHQEQGVEPTESSGDPETAYLAARDQPPQSRSPGDIYVKIGYTDRGIKRLREWNKDCKENVTLLLFYGVNTRRWQRDSWLRPSKYPLLSPSYHACFIESRSKALAKDKLPDPFSGIHQVEEAIHESLTKRELWLGRRWCSACSRGHREWFRIPKSPEGIKMLDDIIHECLKIRLKKKFGPQEGKNAATDFLYPEDLYQL